jgi:hypothetical protein
MKNAGLKSQTGNQSTKLILKKLLGCKVNQAT